jgi:PEP-CTERM motif
MKNWIVSCAALAACAVSLLSAAANAAPIEYIFTGTGTGTLGDHTFDGAFTVSLLADTSTVTSGGGELRNTGSMSFMSGFLGAGIPDDVLIENTASPGFMGFSQNIAPFPDESLTATIFETYNLMTALPLTSGGLSVAPATFLTGGGDLTFETITSLSFTAIGGVPEPSTWAMMLLGFASLGFVSRRSRKAAAQA